MNRVGTIAMGLVVIAAIWALWVISDSVPLLVAASFLSTFVVTSILLKYIIRKNARGYPDAA